MQIRVTQSIAIPYQGNRRRFRIGEVHDLPDELAAWFVERGFGEEVKKAAAKKRSTKKKANDDDTG